LWSGELRALLPKETRRLQLVHLGEKQAGGSGFLPVNLPGRVETWEDRCVCGVRINLFDLGKTWSCNSGWKQEESLYGRSESCEQPSGRWWRMRDFRLG